jgi:hypothetical protein
MVTYALHHRPAASRALMRGPVVFAFVAMVAAVLPGGCSRNLATRDAAQASFNTDGGSDTSRESSADHPPFAIDAILPIDLSLPDAIPTADPDAGTCSPSPGKTLGLVCFGADPAPYQQYLLPVDGGPTPGHCPVERDFIPVRGESCGYISCGPLLGSAVADLADAGAAAAGDAGTDCCFIVVRICGF